MATTGSSFSESQALSRAAPTLATDGQSLKDLVGIVVGLETATPGSQTISGGGTLQCYVYDPFLAAWARLPEMDITLTGATGMARAFFEPYDVVCSRAARVLWCAASVTVSAGTTVTVYQLGQSKVGVY